MTTRDMRATNHDPALNKAFREEAGIPEPETSPLVIWLLLSTDNGEALEVMTFPWSAEGTLESTQVLREHLTKGDGVGAMVFVSAEPPAAVVTVHRAIEDGKSARS
jgi:hypothetical protein